MEKRIKGTPHGFESSVEEGPGGWAVWAKRDDGSPPCPGDGCTAPYSEDPDERTHPLECPSCGAVGCEECIMPMGRGCICLNCEDDEC